MSAPGAGPLLAPLPAGHRPGHPLRPALRPAPRLQEHQGEAGAVSDAGPRQHVLGGRGHAPALPQDVPQLLNARVHQDREAAAGEAESQTQLHGRGRRRGERRLPGEPDPAPDPRIILCRVLREIIILWSRRSSKICHRPGGKTRSHMLRQ